MADSATLVSMAHERKVENLRTFLVNLANSRGFSLPETKLFDQKFLELCLSRTPDHPTYSAMIFIAITELNEEDGSCEETISDFIKSKYKNLPFAHTSLLSHHLAMLVKKREIFCDYNNYCYTLLGEKKKTVASTYVERKSSEITVRTNDQLVVNEVMTRPNEEESVRILKSGDLQVDSLEERSLTESVTSFKDNGVKTKDSTVETLTVEGVAEESKVALGNNESEGRIEASNEEGELYEVVVLDEQNDVLMKELSKEEDNLLGIISKQRKAKLRRTEVKSEACERLWECQMEACGNIIALEKMLKKCREKDQLNKADGSGLPLSMESCKELKNFTHKIQSQLSEIINSFDEAVVPHHESRKCEIENKEREFGPKKKPQVKKRAKRLHDLETTVLRKSPRVHKLI